MCEHLEERVSERLARTTNQPRQRGYEFGCQQRGTQGVGKSGYNVKTLMGNWAEEQFDSKFNSRRSALLSDRERCEAHGRVSVTAGIAERGAPATASVLRTDHTFKGTQDKMVNIVDGSGRVFPGHLPERDLHLQSGKLRQWESEANCSFSDPDGRPDRPRPAGTGRAMGPMAKESSVVARVRAKILERGGKSGFRGIKRALTIMDDNKNNKLSPEELGEGMAVYGVHLEPKELATVFAYFDRDRSGQITIGEFLRGIRGGMNDRRLKLVRMAYKCLDKNADGHVTFSDIQTAYDASQHPAVLSGEMTEEEVLKDFIADWDKDGDGDIALDEFVDYYEDISAGIDNEQYFELMIRNAWHISGGTGAAANTSCRRVLVVHTNGRQTVEEIKNDLGIGPNDIDKMIENLNAQGITDISRIELKGAA
eukprot:TRINITY_DN956_c0_g1_i1.p1 TRINITY_DN956_c0_g1~~TRINITY_DN956_c0_g1_i1.p1  ORF type:complete len:452 (+),score=176.10 TRINITY_DN956_c0_g1_i1:87-1358(+)